jgi:EpsG family
LVYYWLLFVILMIAAIREAPGPGDGRISPALLSAGVLLWLSIGLRFDVGGDWRGYNIIYKGVARLTLEQALQNGDPAYQAINWASSQLGADIWLVNLICGALFCWGLVRFAACQARPMLTVLVALPYLVIVVAMGYTRQATAIGLLLGGLAAFRRSGSIVRFAIYVAVAAAFHKTAVVAFPLVALAGRRSGFVNLLIALSVTVLFYALFLAKDSDRLVNEYVSRGAASDGAGIRVAMSLLPALIFFAWRKRLTFDEQQHALWRNFAVTSVVCLAMLVVLPSSTAVDRLALYVIPLQLGIFAALPDAMAKESTGKSAVVAYAFAVQFIWLNFASHARYWLPYQTVLLS